MGTQPLDVHTVRDETALRLVLLVVTTRELGEAPVVGDVDLLTSREFELGTTQSLDGMLLLVILASHGDQHLSDVDTSDLTVGLTERTSHTGLEPIGTSTRKHLVHTKDMEWMRTDSDMVGLLTSVGRQVLVHRDTSGLQRLGGQLLVLVRDHVDGRWEGIRILLLHTDVIDTDLWIRHTSAKS